MTIVGRYTTGLLDISARVCYNADNIRHGQPETGCCAEILFERSCRKWHVSLWTICTAIVNITCWASIWKRLSLCCIQIVVNVSEVPACAFQDSLFIWSLKRNTVCMHRYRRCFYYVRVMESGIHTCLRHKVLGVRISPRTLCRIDGTEYMTASKAVF